MKIRSKKAALAAYHRFVPHDYVRGVSVIKISGEWCVFDGDSEMCGILRTDGEVRTGEAVNRWCDGQREDEALNQREAYDEYEVEMLGEAP